MESFHEQFPPECLPKELGGTQGSLQEYHGTNLAYG